MTNTLLTVAGGGDFDLADPRPDLDTICTHLSRLPRFGGAVPAYSVLHHSVLVAAILSAGGPLMQLYGLLHDAHEAYTGDITRPVQLALGEECRAAISQLQDRVQLAVYRELEIRPPSAAEAQQVAQADDLALSVEYEHFFGRAYPGPLSRLPPARTTADALLQEILSPFCAPNAPNAEATQARVLIDPLLEQARGQQNA